MRHGDKINNLGRKSAHRKAMLSNMACSLIEHKRITTTLAKAKALRLYVEPLLTKSKSDTTHSRRVVFSYLQNKEAAAELFRDIAPKVMDRPGGYTRIIKLPSRMGDNADMAMIELVDFNELLLGGGDTKKKTRRRGGSTKKTADAKVEEPKAEVVIEEPVKEDPSTEEANESSEEPKSEE
jgi:large subunit ribosomal protein L17